MQANHTLADGGKCLFVSLCVRLGQLKAAFGGDYILSSASVTLSKLRHNRVMQLMSQILEDLVQGKYAYSGTYITSYTVVHT